LNTVENGTQEIRQRSRQGAGTKRVSIIGTFALDNRPEFSYVAGILLTKDVDRVTPADRGKCGSRGQGLVTSAPGRLRDNARPA
jgi:hypothetical protein